MRFIDYGSIKQFRNIVKDITMTARYNGKDADGNVVFNSDKLPILDVILTEKIHGTNAGVSLSSYDNDYVMNIQSRNGIIEIGNDNAGCAFFCETRRTSFESIIIYLANQYNIDLEDNIITLFGEFCGGNIQKNSAVSGLDKRFIIFQHFKVSPKDENSNEPAYWLDTLVISDERNSIFNITNFPYKIMTIDFNRPDLANNDLLKLIEDNEHSSPVGKVFGINDNILEGYVATFEYDGIVHKFKVKGEKHSSSKVKTLVKVDNVLEQKKIDFANYSTPTWRLEQMWQNLFGVDNEKEIPDMKHIGVFLRLLHSDIVKEESDIMIEKELEPKQVNGLISKIAKNWFISELNKQ